MGFGISKHSGAGKAPDMMNHIGAGAAFVATPSTIEAGLAVTITAGKLVAATTGDAIAGYITCNYGHEYTGGGTVEFPDGVDTDTGILFQPATAINPVAAPIEVDEAAAGDILVGETLNIHTTGTGLNGTTSATGVDFLVQKILKTDATTGKAKLVEGIFVDRGYYI